MKEKTREKYKKKLSIFSGSRKRSDYMTDIQTVILEQSPRGAQGLVWLILIFFLVAVIWASVSEVQELTHAEGKVIPSSQIQVVQNLEGGIIKEIHVREGEVVEEGQLLLTIDDTRFSAPYRETKVKYLTLRARIARLEAEANDRPLVFDSEIAEGNIPEIRQRETELYKSRKLELEAKLRILREQINQRSLELEELVAKRDELRRTYDYLQREVALTEPLVKQGAVSEVEMLRLKREASTMRGELESTELSIPAAESRLTEARDKLKEEVLAYKNKAKEELNEVYSELEALDASSVALEDRLKRTQVRSPVFGTINQILVNTIGGVIKPGMDLIEIVPLEDTLLIEARVKPKDIAFIRPKQKAKVSFTAYDFTVFGGLEGEIEHISADSVLDEQGRSYYLIRVRTNKNYLGSPTDPLPIIPGMVASVDIQTGKKTILSYLLKPVLRAKSVALTER